MQAPTRVSGTGRTNSSSPICCGHSSRFISTNSAPKLAAVFGCFLSFENLLAGWAYCVAIRVTAWNPNFSAKCYDWFTRNSGFKDVRFSSIVSKPIMIPFAFTRFRFNNCGCGCEWFKHVGGGSSLTSTSTKSGTNTFNCATNSVSCSSARASRSTRSLTRS